MGATMTPELREAKAKRVLEAWNSGELKHTAICQAFHVGREFVVEVIEQALADGRTTRPIDDPIWTKGAGGRL